MSVLGTRVLRKEDRRFLTVGGTYVDDLRDERLAGAAYATFVRSPVAHGRLRSVDLDAAREAPGVVLALAAADVGLPDLPMEIRGLNDAMARPLLARDVVRYVGEPVALILTEERYQGEDAAELVRLDIDALPAVVDVEEAAQDRVLVHEAAGTNVAFTVDGDFDPALFDGCDVVVRRRIVNQRVAAAPLESRTAAAAWGDDGRLTFWASTQTPHSVRDALAEALGVEQEAVHLIAPDVGGGFGARIGFYPEDVLVARAARLAGRPVRWAESRTENLTGMSHGRAQVQEIAIGGSRDGIVEAYRLDVLQDAGGYPALGAFLPFFTAMMACGTYAIPKVETRARSIATNTAPLKAYRGAGRPEATAAIERAMDLFAHEIGMDPAEVRRRNLMAPDAFPVTTPGGAEYDSGDYPQALARALEAAGYDALREEQARRRASGDARQLGIGMSTYVEVTTGMAFKEDARVEVLPDGTATVLTGTSPHGQGHETVWSMIAQDRLGIPFDRIRVLHGDTDLVPRGVGTMGSRSLQVGGSAVHVAAGEVVEKGRDLAARLLEVAVEDVEFDPERGRFQVRGVPESGAGWEEIARAAQAEGGLAADTRFASSGASYPFGAHVAVVSVDVETGKVTLERIVTVDDSGTLANPLLVEGQRHGGIAQGAAQALLEEVLYDPAGNPLTANFADYAFVTACELPSPELVTMETPTPLNPLGAKGIGESGTIGSTPAVQSAVVDAVRHLGVDHIDIPTTPQRVWSAIQAAGGAS